MEFWIGLSVGMHLGRFIAEYLQKCVEACGLLSPSTVQEIAEVEKLESEVGSIVDRMTDEDDS